MIRFYDTRTRGKRTFEPQQPGRAGLYWCGPTVYDSFHLGHARAAIVPDVVRRWLEYRGHVVRFVTNITDVDDKIIQRSLAENRDWRELTSVYIEEYGQLCSALGNLPPDVYPRATDHIEPMVELIAQLIENGHAYAAADGDVYFEVTSYDTYGGLSGRRLEDQRVGSSGRIDEERLAVKRSPGDFILWKLNSNDPEEWQAAGDRVPSWPSPWGRGRPGWHLECSVMSKLYLGAPFDIHGGGQDLIFPHHENERAQSNCVCGADETDAGEVVRYWLHNGFINVQAETEEERASEYGDGDVVKMSKSLGNVKWVREMIWPSGPLDPLVIRMLMLSNHYRSPITFSSDLVDQAVSRLGRIYGLIETLAAAEPGRWVAPPPGDSELDQAVDAARESFEKGMDDDLNTAVAMASIFELVGTAKKELVADGEARRDESAGPPRRRVLATLRRLLGALGFPGRRAAAPAADAEAADREQGLLDLLGDLRTGARADKNWALADRLRDELASLGYEIRDSRDGSVAIVRK